MTRRRCLRGLVTLLVLTLASAAWADPFDEGSKAAARGDYEAAIWFYGEDINSGANTPENLAVVYNNRGNAHNRLGRLDQALADYDRALELRPGYAFAYNNRGSVREARGELDQALADYALAIHFKPDYAKAYGNRAEVLLKLGRPRQALPDAERGVALDPGDTLTQRVLQAVRSALDR